jgi:hypothetical protein
MMMLIKLLKQKKRRAGHHVLSGLQQSHEVGIQERKRRVSVAQEIFFNC